MKRGPLTLFILACAIGPTLTSGGGDPGTLSGRKVGNDQPLACNIPILRSYLLKGMHLPTDTEPMLVCPSIKSSCCTKADQQRIFHIVNDIIPQRILNYEERVKTALASIKRFHEHVVANQPQFIGNARRRAYCMRQARAVYSFPFGQFFSRLYDTLIEANFEMRDYYNRFYCVLCDSRNHPFIQTSGKVNRVTFDAKFCQETLQTRTDVINMLNVQLVSYLVSLQNLVDCKHYVRSYNLDFFAVDKIKNTVDLLACTNFINSREFLKFCKSTCQQLSIGRVVTLVQGDLDFLNDSVNLFRKFFEFRESGNFVSAKLRKFFKSHVIEVKQTSLPDRALASRTTIKKKDLRLLDKFKRVSEQQFKRASALYKSEERRAKNDEFLKGLQQKKPGGLFQKTVAPARQAPKTILSKLDTGVNSGRLLAAAASAPVNAAHPPSPVVPSPADLGDKKFRSPKLSFGKGSAQTYQQIHIEKKGTPVSYVYKIQPTPIEFDSCVKVFQSSGGVNPNFYESLAFDMTQRQFYRKLFGETATEKPDTQLHFMLADFTPESLEEAREDLHEEFRIDPDNWAGLDQRIAQ